MWKQFQPVALWLQSVSTWCPGEIQHITEDTDGTLVEVRYWSNPQSQQPQCNTFTSSSAYIHPINTNRALRNKWRTGSEIECFNDLEKPWCDATVVGIIYNEETKEEVLNIEYCLKQSTDATLPQIISKEVPRSAIWIRNRYPVTDYDKPPHVVCPLHRFTPKDICDEIEQWIRNDINYKSNLCKVKKVFDDAKLSGLKINTLGKTLRIVMSELLSDTLTHDTLDIMFNGYEEWNNANADDVKCKPAQEIAEILFNIPLNNVLERIRNNCIDGTRFIESIIDGSNMDILMGETGWDEDEIYQIQSILCRHHTFTQDEFKQNMDRVFVALSTDIADKLKDAISQYNVEDIHYRIKNALNIDAFSECMINIVDELTERNKEYEDSTVQRIYGAISECFVYNTDIADDLRKLQHWICNNCSTCNINAMINSEYTIDVPVCTLCGITQKDQIASKIRDKDSYIMVNDSNTNVMDDDKNDDIDIMIQRAIEGDGAFNLCCPNRNDNASCPTILRLLKTLIIHKRWSYTIAKKGKHDITKAIQIDIDQYIDDNTFKTVFMDSIKAIELITETQMKSVLKLMPDNYDEMFDIKLFFETNISTFTEILHTHTNSKTLERFGSNLYFDINKALKETAKNEGIHKTNIDNDTFKKIFIESTQFLQNQTTLLSQMLEQNVDNIADIKLFSDNRRKEFAQKIRKHTNIKIGIGLKLHSKIKDVLKNIAQREEFGQFLSDLDISNITKDYQHILKIHIHNGNKSSIENAFRSFEYVVHYQDSDSEKETCKSSKRRAERMEHMNTKHKEEFKTEDRWTFSDDIDVCALKQHYIQSMLDTIHSYLVHSKWERFVQRYIHKHSQYEDEDGEICDIDVDSDEATFNKDKYTTNVAEYGFGIDHSHPYLKSNYHSIHDELMLNKLYRLSPNVFQIVMVKAIKLHNIALIVHKELMCKYYENEYNLIRNEPIGLRHIFAIVIYTDLGKFCTEFRKTYRRIDADKSDEDVTKRHQEIYYYARSLYEAIEFFGKCMGRHEKVYHGLDRILHFDKFSAYFNQPISTTTELITARQFCKGSGIILTLTAAATESQGDPSMVTGAKYLSVSWLSRYPDEEELLYYGEYINFKIANIHNIEDNKLQGHSPELLLLNKFQRTVDNAIINWNRNTKELQGLLYFIQQRQNPTFVAPPSKYITKFGKTLFEHFCDGANGNKICIKNFISLPNDLIKILFTDSSRISLIPIATLFKNAQEIILNELNVHVMNKNAKNYVHAVLQYIQYSLKNKDTNVQKIVFKSISQKIRKDNSTLKKNANQYLKKYQKNQWGIQYEHSVEGTHDLIFINQNNSNEKSIAQNDESEYKQEETYDYQELNFRFKQLSSVKQTLLQSETSVAVPENFNDDDYIKDTPYLEQNQFSALEHEWKELFRDKGSIYTVDEITKTWVQRGVFGIVCMLQSSIDADDVCIRFQGGNDVILWWRLASSKLKLKGERALVLKAWVTHNQYEILAIRFSDQATVIIFAKEYQSVFPMAVPDATQIDNIFKNRSRGSSVPQYILPALPPPPVLKNEYYSDPLRVQPQINQKRMVKALPDMAAPIIKSWKCTQCTYVNQASSYTCVMCNLPKDYNQSWECAECTYVNKPSTDTCVKCDLSKYSDKNKWQCGCTFKNHEWTNRCEVCSAERRAEKESDTVQDKDDAIVLHKPMIDQIEFEYKDEMGSQVYNDIPPKHLPFEDGNDDGDDDGDDDSDDGDDVGGDDGGDDDGDYYDGNGDGDYYDEDELGDDYEYYYEE